MDLMAAVSKMEVAPRDISAYAKGNTSIPYVHSFDSGIAGPHVWINGLMHGNEFCGMTAVTWLLDNNVRPLKGKLSLSLANVAAYGRFDASKPLESRFVDRDMNRVWSPDLLGAPDGSVEVARALELVPLAEVADAILDIHSTSTDVRPMSVYMPTPGNTALAEGIQEPRCHILLAGGQHKGATLVEWPRIKKADGTCAGIVVECGGHFRVSSGDFAIGAAVRFLARQGLVSRDFAAPHEVAAVTPDRFQVTQVTRAETPAFRFAKPWVGFEELEEGEIYAYEGEEPLRAPYARCAMIMPRRVIKTGEEAVTLARHL